MRKTSEEEKPFPDFAYKHFFKSSNAKPLKFRLPIIFLVPEMDFGGRLVYKNGKSS